MNEKERIFNKINDYNNSLKINIIITFLGSTAKWNAQTCRMSKTYVQYWKCPKYITS